MSRRLECLEISGEEELLFADGFDDCILGVSEPGPNQPARVVYDAYAMVKQLAGEFLEEPGRLRDADTAANDAWDDAREYLDFNTFGAWVGEQTPLYLWRLQDETDEQD